MQTRSFLLAALVAASLAPSGRADSLRITHLVARVDPAQARRDLEARGLHVALARRRGRLRRATDLLVVGPTNADPGAALGQHLVSTRSLDRVTVTVAYSTGPKPPEKWWDFSPPHPFDPGIGMQRYHREVSGAWTPEQVAAELPALALDPVAFTVGRIRTEAWGGHVGGYLAHLVWSVRHPDDPRPLVVQEVEGVHGYGP